MFPNRNLEEIKTGVLVVRNKGHETWGNVVHMAETSSGMVKSSAQTLLRSYKLPPHPRIPGSFLLLKRPSAETSFQHMVTLAIGNGGSIISVEAGLLAALMLKYPMPPGLSTVLIGHAAVYVALRERRERVPARLAIIEATDARPAISTWDKQGEDQKAMHPDIHAVLFRLR